jgi:hypothetical protein
MERHVLDGGRPGGSRGWKGTFLMAVAEPDDDGRCGGRGDPAAPASPDDVWRGDAEQCDGDSWGSAGCFDGESWKTGRLEAAASPVRRGGQATTGGGRCGGGGRGPVTISEPPPNWSRRQRFTRPAKIRAHFRNLLERDFEDGSYFFD